MKLTKQIVFAPFVLLSFAVAGKAQPATIKWNDVHQKIQGFGASSATTSRNLTNRQADLLFPTTNGVGLSLLRASPTNSLLTGTAAARALAVCEDLRAVRFQLSTFDP
jgi:O-glycosyl hydrolase